MDALVGQRRLQGGELVKVVRSLLPGSSIEDVLDEVRNIVNKRISIDLTNAKFETGLHVLEEICKKDYDTDTLLSFLICDPDFPIDLRTELAVIRDSGLINSFTKFVKAKEPKKCVGCFTGRKA